MTTIDPPLNAGRRGALRVMAGAALPLVTGLASEAGRAAVTGNSSVASWAIQSDPVTWAQAWAARFTNPLLNPLSKAPLLGSATAFYAPNPGTTNRFSLEVAQTQQDVLGVPGKATRVWGYRNFETGVPTYPGRSFEVTRNVPIVVRWYNSLVDAKGKPLPHLLPVDQTITIQSPTTGVPVATHHHGGDTAVEYDGLPDQWLTPLRKQVGPGVGAASLDGSSPALRYEYTNQQEASLHWYHDHAESLTRINVHAGLAGLYVVRDANEAQLLARRVIPRAPYEVGLVLQDRCFDAAGNLAYSANPADYPVPEVQANLPANNPTHMPEMFGDVIVVNGKAWPTLKVEQRPYRLRLLNGSDSRFYTLGFGPAKVFQIGGDLGLLNYGVPMGAVTIAPGERLDLVVDFSRVAMNASIIVTNSAPTPYPFGLAPGQGTSEVMRIEVALPLNKAVPVTQPEALPYTLLRCTLDTPYLLPAVSKLALSRTPTVRRILLGEGTDQYGRITPLLGVYDPANAAANRGTLTFADPPTERPRLGSTEVWEFWNVSPDAHPVHLHLVQFQAIDRRPFAGPTLVSTTMSNGWQGVKLIGAPAWVRAARKAPRHEEGWKDTVVCPPNEVTRVLVQFNRRGKYVYHCHILSHEEHDMMRWYEVV